jgi:rRNA maturation protein Nop10
MGENVATASRQLSGALTPTNKEQWAASDPRDWANESFALAEAAKVHYCARHGTSCDQPCPPRFEIDDMYIEANVSTVREQLSKAGVRLAKLLDAALGHGH